MISAAEGSHYVLPPNQHFSLSAKINGRQRRALVNTLYVLWYANWAEVTSNSKKINPLLSYACLKASGSWSVSHSVSRKFHYFNSVAIFESILGQSQCFVLS